MAGLKDQAARRSDIFFLDPHRIAIADDHLDRDPTESLKKDDEWLTDNIKEKGVIQPLTVYMNGDVPTITDGRRRLRCALAAGVATIPVRAEEKALNTKAGRIISSVLRNTGRPYTPVELSRRVVELEAEGMSRTDIATALSFTRTYVDDLFSIAAMPGEVKDMVNAGTVAAATARKVLKNEGDAKGAKLLKDVAGKAAAEGKTRITDKHIKAAAPAKAETGATDAYLRQPKPSRELELLKDVHGFIAALVADKGASKELLKQAKALLKRVDKMVWAPVKA